jgi:NDP-sugar pyrophosphorylase family protein
MQAVILAAGRGTRLGNLSQNTPKPLVKAKGKSLIEYNLEKLPRQIDEIIIVVGYLKEQIINQLGFSYEGRKIKYIEQKELLGTGHALHLCRALLKDKFLVFMGDDIYAAEDMRKCLKHDSCILVKKVPQKTTAAKMVVDKKGNLKAIIEEANEAGILVNTGLYVLTPAFFKYSLVPIKSGKEFGLPHTIVKMARDYKVKIEQATFWAQINTPEELARAEELLEKERN